jgi:hypothetical protein
VSANEETRIAERAKAARIHHDRPSLSRRESDAKAYERWRSREGAPRLPFVSTIIIHLPAIRQLGTITAIIAGFVSESSKRG